MSTNKMKLDISQQALSDIFKKHNLGNIQSADLMTGGEFNSVYKIVTDDSKKYVIKIAPSSDIDVLTYEHNLIQSEVFAYEKLAELKSVHIPEIFGYSQSSDEPYQYLIMEFIEGKTLSKSKLTDEETAKVTYSLGQTMAEIHSIAVPDGFGYLQNGLKRTWKDAYLSMVDSIIRDGLTKKAKIPYLEEIKSLINQNLSVLDEVKTPALIHFDLWAGNIILDKNNDLYSLIDCERVMFGDVMGEFISLDYITPFSLEKNKSLIAGYRSCANRNVEFNNNEMIRLYLMRLYLGLIANIETSYRYRKMSLTFLGRYLFSKHFLKVSIRELKKHTQK